MVIGRHGKRLNCSLSTYDQRFLSSGSNEESIDTAAGGGGVGGEVGSLPVPSLDDQSRQIKKNADVNESS